MIKTIIKRDGSSQEFSAEKLNGWGIWAADNLGHYVSWPDVVLTTVSTLPKKCTSIELQERLIKVCLDMGTFSYQKMAGRLYSAMLVKLIHNSKIPTIHELHKTLVKKGLMSKLNYSDSEYEKAEKIIKHDRNLYKTHGSIHHIRLKYSIRNRSSNKEYETAQFVFMRMAMSLSETSKPDVRMKDVENFYNHFSLGRINAPTPNYVNLGTKHKGYASCCLYTVDDNARSLAIGDHIAYTMTYMSAGIGSHLNIRSIGDQVKGGTIQHQGKLPYYRSMVGSVTAQLQNGRGGACTTHYNMFDPEVEIINKLKNPKSTDDKKIRGMDYSAGSNKFFARKAAKQEKIFLFNSYTTPDLYNALYSNDAELFEELYLKYEKNNNFKKTYIDARKILIDSLNEGYETGNTYLHFIDEINKHTPFNETIYSLNLCQEIAEVTKPYNYMPDLYSTEDHGRGEIASCSLAGLCPAMIKTEKEYSSAAYYALLMIDRCIHMTSYELPHMGVTAKARMNAGVGIVGLAHYLAKNKQKYSTPEGKQFINELSERHYWHLLNASLRLGKELGNAKWMHKTKWPDGWTPLATYNKNVDKIVSTDLNYDWDSLSNQIVENGGIRNSVLVAHMPAEASSKATGSTNGLYPIRDLVLKKSDGNLVTHWSAPDGDKIWKEYEIAWDINTTDMIDCYAIIQKWTDQTISADLYRKVLGDETIGSSEMLSDYFYMIKMGLKSRYYQNSLTSEGIELNTPEPKCTNGVCTL